MSDDDKSLPESLITPEQVQSTFSAAPIHEEPKPEEKVETPDETLPDMITPDVVKSTFSREPIKSLNKVEQFASKYEKGDINQISPEETRVMSLWTPQEWHDLKKLRPDLAIPDNKAREIFDAKRAGQIVDKEGPGLLTQLGQGAKSFAHGVEQIFEDKNPYVKDPVTGEYPISDVERLRALGSAPLKVGEAANYLAAHAINEPIPSLWGFTDWVGEKLGHQTPDDTFKKEQARNLIDTARAADERAHQSIYSRYAQTPAVKNAIKGGLTLLGADKDTSPEALDSHAQKIADRWSASQNYPVNPDIELVSSFLAPKGLGMEDFAVATTALGAFQKALKIPAAIRGVEAEQALQARKTLDAVGKASKVGVFTEAAGKTADALDNLSTSLEEFKKARPYTAGVLSTVPGVIIGSQMDKEHPIAGAVLGGLGEGAAVKYLGKAAANAPRILADLGEARAITAGGGKLFETAGAAAEKGSATEKIFGGFKGRTLDKLSDLATSYGRGGIDMLGLGAALGAIKGEDWEDTKNAMGQGLAYGLFHQTLGKMMGQDPIVHQRNLHRKDIEFTKQLQQMSPETQDTVLHFQDWDTYLGLLQKQLSDAQGRYGEAVKSGDQEEASKAGNLVNQISDQLQRGSNADLHTRQAYARSIGDLFTDALRAANGPFREGQKNIGMEILNTNQIVQKLQANNPGMTPQVAQGITSMGHFFSPVGGGRGIELGGNIPDALKPVVEGKVFDPLKSTVVMNADLIKDGIVNRNQTPAEAFRHEWGHALWSIPEFKDLMIANGVEEGLFDTTYTDLNGNPQRVTQGQFSNKDLNDRFWDEYLKNIRQDPGETQKQAQERYAKNLGMWDDSNKRWDEDKIANYMKNEVRADVYGKGLGGTGLDSLDSVSQHILDWTRVKVKNSLVKRAVEGILGHGGSDPYNSISSPATGVNNLSPELLSAYRNAFREFKDLNGQVTQSNDEGRIMPVISPLKMANSASLRQKYGRDSGLFKTEFRATVYDKDGKPTGSVTLPGQNIFEGVWGSESGSLVQRSGYGAAPADIEGMPVPPGGTIKISREIVMKPDGETPEMLSRKEIKDLAKTRAQTIRDALDTSYKGEPNGFRSVSEDGLTYRGTFTPEQIAAIRALPEAVVPAKIKDTILRFNDLLAKGEGHRMLIDYAARVDDKGRAVAFSPQKYDLVPIGMHFSKDGNFLITTVSVSRLLDKLNLWGDRFSGRLAPWGGDKEAFFREFATKYLPNHLEKWQNPEGPDKPLVARPGETELDPDPKVALQKKHVFNDFLNLTTNEFRDRNPDRTIIPRRKGDPRGKFPDRTIMSVRADAVADMLESSAHPLPVNYELQKWNFLPAKEPGLSFAPKGDEPALKPTEENPILKGMGATGRTPYAQPVRSANQDVRDISKQYVESVGLPYNPHGQAVPVNEALAKRIADHYEEAKHDPNDPKVKKAYTALANETVDQWKSFQKAGYTATPWTGKGQPYANSAEMMKDVRDNKHLYYFPTESGFGTEKNTPAENPMLEDSGVNFNGADNVPVNDVFRVVHDIVGHGANGYEFGPKGEFNAYLEHSRMFSKEAKPALAAETLAQNSWVNFGPHLRDAEGNLAKKGEQGYVPVTERPFAEQKNIALPKEFIDAAESQTETKDQGPSFLPAKKLDEAYDAAVKGGGIDAFKGKLQSAVDSLPDPIEGKVAFDYHKGGIEGLVEGFFMPSFKVLGAFVDWHNAATGSQYITIKIPTENETYKDAVENGGDLEEHKITIRDHNVSPFRVKEFGSPTKVIQVDDFDTKENVLHAATRLSEHLAGILEPYREYLSEKANSDAIAERMTTKSGQKFLPSDESHRFDLSKQDIRFMPASKQDEAHAKAIESGDMEEAQRLVDEKARQAGYTIGPVYHGTSQDFNVFDPNKNSVKSYGEGFYFTDNSEVSGRYGEKTISAYLKLKNPIEIEYAGKDEKGIPKYNKLTDVPFNESDGTIIKNPNGTIYRVANNNNIKSADPATYDDNGKLIPLSQRFDTSKQDIRFMPASKEPKFVEDAGFENEYVPEFVDEAIERYAKKNGLRVVESGRLGEKPNQNLITGEPVLLKMYHATRTPKQLKKSGRFDPYKLGGTFGAPNDRLGWYFSSDGMIGDEGEYVENRGDVLPFAITMKNPLVIGSDFEFVENKSGTNKLEKMVKDGNHDGIIAIQQSILAKQDRPKVAKIYDQVVDNLTKEFNKLSPKLRSKIEEQDSALNDWMAGRVDPVHGSDVLSKNPEYWKFLDEHAPELVTAISYEQRGSAEDQEKASSWWAIVPTEYADKNIKLRTGQTYDKKGNLIPLSNRFDDTKSNFNFMPAKKLTAQHPSKEKEGSVGGELDLVHFGPYGIKTTDPKKFGKGIATPVDLQGDYKTYFYLNDGRNYEGSMRGKVPYVAKVDGNSIYNLEQDPLGVNSMPNRLKRDETIQEAGYAGYFSPKSFNGSFDAVALYKPTKLTEVQEGKEIFKSKKQSKDFGMQYLPAKKGVDGEPETEERVNPYTNEPKNATPTGATSAQNYPAAQGSGAEDSEKRAGERLRFHSGLAAVARAASSSSEEGLPGAKGAVPRKELEEQALRDHADEHGLWTDPEAFFKQWQFDGSEAGGEHQVSFPSGPDVIKRTYNPYYPTWASYFDAMNVHNTLFPKAAFTFRGFQDVKGSGGVDIYQGKWPAGLYSEVSQPTLEIARGLKMDETDAMMEPLGFYRVRPMEYYNPELKIHMTDLHPQNAVMLRDEKGNEFPYVIDSNIHATGAKAYDAEDVAKVEAKLAAKENPILSALQPPAPGDTGFSFLGAKGRPGITAATELAKEKVDELKTKLESADDDFFTKLWPSLLKKTGLNLKASSQNLGKAASIAVNDVVDWLKTNKKYQDYYHTDRETTKQLLKQEYPEMTEDDFKGFMMFMGLTSPSTKLKENVGEALRVFDLWKNEGSVKSLSLIKTPKGNAGVGSGPFKLIGPTAANKLRTLHYMEDLHKKLGSWDEVSKHLQEPVSMKELNAFNRELGYSGGIGKAGEVKQVVKEATGQDQLIPRMFVFGPKVGAYTLNHVGDDRYTTTDIWEGRFVRSHFPEMFKKGSGLPTNVSEHKIFQTFSSKFNETFKEKTGLDLSPAALQAARWFFMIAKANEAGYKHAKTNGTISEYTEEALRKLRSRTFDADREGSNQEDSEGVE